MPDLLFPVGSMSTHSIDDRLRDLGAKFEAASDGDLEPLMQEFLSLVHQKVVLRRTATLLPNRENDTER